MRQVKAIVVNKNQLLTEPHRSHGRTVLNSSTIQLRCPEIAQEARPGQFVMVRCGECTLPRPFSIHQRKAEDIALFFGVWEDGKGTQWLSQRYIGDSVELFGPLGNGFSINPTARKLLLIAGGIGIAPLYFLAQEALRKNCSIVLLTGASTATQLYPWHLLPSVIKLVVTTEDGTAGKKGKITELLPDFVGQADQIFACGPMPMYRDIADKYRQIVENKPTQVSLEVRMGCGYGVCYGCTVKTRHGLKQVCHDGPVFDLDDVLWEEVKC